MLFSLDTLANMLAAAGLHVEVRAATAAWISIYAISSI